MSILKKKKDLKSINFHLKTLENEEQTKTETNRRKETKSRN